MPLLNQINKLELLDEINIDGFDVVVKRHKRNPISSGVLYEFFEDNKLSENSMLFLANYANTPSRILVEMVQSITFEEVLKSIALHPRTPQESLVLLAQNPSVEVKRYLASSKQITPKTVDGLLESNDFLIDCILAENPELYPRLQVDLANRDNSTMRVALLQRKNLNHEALEICMKASDHWTAIALAFSKNIDEDIILEIADLDILSQQALLVQRDDLSDKVLESLTFSKHKEIAQVAISKKELDSDEFLGWVENDNSEIRKIIATKDNIPKFIETILAKDIDADVLEKLAQNENINERTAMYLIQNDTSNSKLAIALATNKTISENIIKALALLENKVVSKLLALRDDLKEEHLDIMINKNYSAEVIFQLALNNYFYNKIHPMICKYMISHKSPTIRAFAAHSTYLTNDFIAVLFADCADIVRKTLAENITNIKYLENLTSDNNEEIAQIANTRYQKLKKDLETEEKRKELQKVQSKPEPKKEKKTIINKIFRSFKGGK